MTQKRNSYHNYGGRGIVVCADWENDFKAFQKWAIENGYKNGLTIDRKNNDGPYSPENCKWATIKEQANNRRTNRYIDVFGEHLTISEAAQKYGIKPCTIRARIEHGWAPERAVSIRPGETVKLDDIIGVLQTKVNRKNEKSPAKFTRPKMGITKQAGEKSHRQPG